jgi:hypothetical protein
MTPWYDDLDKVLELAYWLAGEGSSVDTICHLYEKPWKYTEEWEEYQKQLLEIEMNVTGYLTNESEDPEWNQSDTCNE